MPAETVAPRDPHLVALTAALAEPFEPREVKFKPQSVKNNRCLAMAYIDARLIQDRLDEVLGVENWTDNYTILNDGSVMCRLRLKLGDRWITKTDVGSPSEQPDSGDRLKAAFSDALKRAAVKFGIGRYLYRLPAQWVDYDGVKKQIVSPPQLPPWALPKSKRAPVGVVKTPPQGGAVLTTGAPAPQPVAAQPAPQPNLPANGTELHRRLQDYDAKLASQKLCSRGALLAHVTQAGVKAGFTANLTDWTGPAIPFAVDAVKEFEKNLRAEKPEPRTAA
jgi:Rad52/22 family double-strand break repair protein